MNPGPTFERVYLALKEQLMRGRFAPGEHLEPIAIGAELHASITPVRDALHRLVGERLVAVPRHDGFRVPSPTEAELRNLYGWNLQLVELGLRSPDEKATLRSHAADQIIGGPSSDPSAEIFARIASRSGNPELEAAIANLNDRLAAIRSVEALLFPDFADELFQMQFLLGELALGELRRAVSAYHRRRQRQTPDLLVLAHSADQAGKFAPSS